MCRERYATGAVKWPACCEIARPSRVKVGDRVLSREHSPSSKGILDESPSGAVIRLRAENAKNGEAELIPLEGELAELMGRRREACQVEITGVPMISSLVFHRAKRPIGDFRKAWATACRKAGVGRLFHDLRRSACRNMVRAGVPQSIAMKVSGHKTDSMFRRYAIVARAICARH
jgi:integrase